MAQSYPQQGYAPQSYAQQGVGGYSAAGRDSARALPQGVLSQSATPGYGPPDGGGYRGPAPPATPFGRQTQQDSTYGGGLRTSGSQKTIVVTPSIPKRAHTPVSLTNDQVPVRVPLASPPTSNRGGGNQGGAGKSAREEALEAENAQLTRALAKLEERFTSLAEEAQATRDSEDQLRRGMEAATSENARLRQELADVREEVRRISEEHALKRQAMQQAMAQAMAQSAPPLAQPKSAEVEQPAPEEPEQPLPARAKSASTMARPRGSRTRAEPAATPDGGATPKGANPRAASSQRSARGGAAAAVPPSAKGADDIDSRLLDFREGSGCDLQFKRLNRGWYQFWTAGQPMRPGDARSVEISIVNGKLMAKLEPSTHDAGWNNGKLGPIERFAAAFASG